MRPCCVAERRLSFDTFDTGSLPSQSSLRDERIRVIWNRGLKPTATFGGRSATLHGPACCSNSISSTTPAGPTIPTDLQQGPALWGSPFGLPGVSDGVDLAIKWPGLGEGDVGHRWYERDRVGVGFS